MIHVSDLLHYKKCPVYCWNGKHKKIQKTLLPSQQRPFYEVWSQYLRLEDASLGEVGDLNQDTIDKLNQSDALIMGRFTYRDCRTRIPLLERTKSGWRVTYPFVQNYPKESEALLMAINDKILKQCGFFVDEYRILYLNKEYVRKQTLDLDEMFLLSDSLFNKRNHKGKSIRSLIDSFEFDLDSWIDQTKVCLEGEQPLIKRNKQCLSSRRCPFYDVCFQDYDLADDSILFLTTSQYKIDDYHKGVERICELPLEHFDGFRLQYAQYMASLQGRFCDRAGIRTWLSQIRYPISYLDFEWDTFAIPPYAGMRPLGVLCFEYSLHIEKEDGSLEHVGFFEGKDCRKSFIESLIQNIPSSGSILVYNMEGAEKLRLQQLALQFPEYKKPLDAICDRMIDLSKPFEAGLFYDVKMRGHYSLKSVLPVFTDEVSYKNLMIQTGTNVVEAYRTFGVSSQEQKEKLRKEICDYCKMDTYAEYVLFHGLCQVAKEDVYA